MIDLNTRLIARIKLAELRRQRDQLLQHYANLKGAAAAAADPRERLRLLYHGLQEAKFALVTGADAPVPADRVHTRSLSLFVAGVRNEWFETLLSGERMQTHFQPIVRLARPREAFAYECLVRGQHYASEWLAEHPKWMLSHWRCEHNIPRQKPA